MSKIKLLWNWIFYDDFSDKSLDHVYEMLKDLHERLEHIENKMDNARNILKKERKIK